jgi:hypothetical protein
MTNTEAASIVAILHGAYPGTYFDGAVAEVFVNSLMMADFATAEQAVTEWVRSMDRFPTVADLNGSIRRIRQRESQDRELAKPQNKIADREQACEAFSRGYIRARTEAGEDLDTINEKLVRHLRAWRLHPANGSEPHERTGLGPKPTVPSRHRRGNLRSNIDGQEDPQPFDGSTSDVPW